jgi:hypothetical protein
MADDRSPGSVDFIPASDALYRDAQWAYAREHRILGHRVVCRSNSRYVCDLFDDAFGVCEQNGAAEAANTQPLRVQILVHDAPEGRPAPVPVRHCCVDATRLLMQSPASAAIVDPERRDATAYVSAELAADRTHFQRAFLDAMTLALLTHFDRHPVHAAAILRGQRAVLLAGPSGAGKSTLAHLAHCAGIPVMSEDTVWIQLEPDFQVWGLPRGVHLLAPAAPGEISGPGLTGEHAARKVVVPLASDRAAPRCSAGAAGVCLLQPGCSTPTLERLTPGEIAAALSHEVAPGFDRYPERHAGVVRALATTGGWRLRLSNDPGEALPLLRRMLDD